jgi:hypothetical protein
VNKIHDWIGGFDLPMKSPGIPRPLLDAETAVHDDE